MQKRMIVVVLVAMIFAVNASAQKSDATNTMSWMDGLSLVVLDTDDIAGLHRARTEIQSHGGRVAIMSPPSMILGWIPMEIRPELIGKAGIREIYFTEVMPGEIAIDEPQSAYMINYYNSVVRGDYQKEFFARSAAESAPGEWPATHGDALQPDPIEDSAYIDNLEKAGLDVGKLYDRGMLLESSQATGNSEAMTGTISVTLFFVESDGTIDPDLYTWTDQHVQDYIDGVNTGLAWWTARAYNYFDCWNAFLVRYFPPTDVRNHQGYEPVLHDSNLSSLWVQTVIGQFGYTSGSVFTRVNAYNTFQRTTYGTDWAYSAFVAYNPPGTPDQFTNGTSAFAYLNGPYTVLLYRSYAWPVEQVFTHESGHIFGACDEYAGGCSTCDCQGLPSLNCNLCSSFLCMMKANDFQLCNWTPAQIGWLGPTGCAPTPLPPPALSGVDPPSGLQGVRTTITLSGSDFVWGAAVDMGPDVTVHGSTVTSDTTIDVDMTPDTDAPLGLVDVLVMNRDFQTDTLYSAFDIARTVYHYASLAGNNVFPYITPADAATTFGDVLGAAGAGDSILVETGVYGGTDSLVLAHGAQLLGAWDATFTTRDVVNGKSTIDLNNSQSHALIIDGVAPVVIDGFIIKNGDGSLQLTPIVPITGRYGGAVYIKDSNVTLTNSVLTTSIAGTGGNYGAGGCLYASGSTVVLQDNEFSNSSAGQGGAVCLVNCTGSLSDNLFSSNQVVFNTQPSQGGAIYISEGNSIALSGNTITNNSSVVGVSGQHHGGGIYVFNSTGISISGGEISYNAAQNNGGGIYYEMSDVVVDGVRIHRNTASFGAGVGTALTGTPTITITECELTWNDAAVLAGGVQAIGNAFVDHNLFVGNNANSIGGGAYLSSLATGSFIGNTMDRNTSGNTGGVSISGSAIPVRNNIIANSGDAGLSCAGTDEGYNNVWNSAGADFSGCSPGTGSISSDPFFADTAATDYHLAIHSPSIDAGDPDPTYDDPDGSRGDMGMYGSHAFTMDQPSYPKNAVASIYQGDVILRWDPNPEADLQSYAVYKDTLFDFIPSAMNFDTLVTAPDSMVSRGAFADTCYYRVVAIDTSGYASGFSNTTSVSLATAIPEVASSGFRLHQNHPNPFNPTTLIRYEIDERIHVTLTVYDVQGRQVRRLVDATRSPGPYVAEWDGRNARGETVSSGIYFYRLQAGPNAQTRKMVMLK